MSVEFWTNAERFYEFWFIILTVLLLNLLIVIIFGATYTSKEKKKIFNFIMVSSAAIIVIVGFVGHYRYHPYLEQASYSNPLVRDREPRFNTYVYYSNSEQNHYLSLNDLDSLRNLELYEDEQVIEPVTYLGAGEFTHYFEHSNGEFFRQNRQIEFVEMTKQAQLVGSRFTLKDSSFKEIGFKNPETIMYEQLEIPVSERGMTYEPEDESQFLSAQENVSGWNF